MLGKLFTRPVPFLILVTVVASCHFGGFAVCYFFYRKSYYLAPTFLQSVCGVVSLILAYPLHVIKWIPSEPNKLLFVLASMLNSLIYAVVLVALLRLFRRSHGAET